MPNLGWMPPERAPRASSRLPAPVRRRRDT